MLRVLQVGLGPLGRMIVADAARRGIAAIGAAVDTDPALAGKPLRELVPESGSEARVVGSIQQAGPARNFDAAVVTTSSDLRACAPTLRELIEMGLPVVSTCEELLYPLLRHAELAHEFDARCRTTGARLLATGINPGFLMDALPVAATAVCRRVRGVKAWRIQDATHRRLPFQRKIGAGLDDAAFAAKVAAGSLRHVGLGESLHFIAHYLGMPIGRWSETIDPIKADRDLACALGPIPRGRCAGVRQVAKGWAAGAAPTDAPIIELDFRAAIGQPDPHDRVVIDGEPPLDLVIRGGVHGDIATSAITLNAIPSIMGAPPGLHTMATIPLVRFAASRPA